MILSSNLPRISFLVALIGCFLFPLSARAQVSDSIARPVSAAGDATELLLGNPPLPQLYSGSGATDRLKLQPYYYMGKLEASDNVGSFHGGGGGVSYSGGRGRWGYYVFAAGSALTGNFTNSSNPILIQQMPNVSASFEVLNAGITHRFFGENPGEFTLPLFVGPMIENVDMSSTVHDYSAGTLVGDYSISGHQLIVGFMGGVQAGIPLGKGWVLNPFAIGGAAGPREIKHLTVTTRIADSNSIAAQTAQADFASVLLNAGINVIYTPWSLSANLTSPILGDSIPKAVQAHDSPLAGMHTTLFSISWAFGKDS